MSLKDRTKDLIFNFQNIYYFLNNLCNLVSFGVLNDSRIYYDNKNKTLYQVKSKQILAQM